MILHTTIEVRHINTIIDEHKKAEVQEGDDDNHDDGDDNDNDGDDDDENEEGEEASRRGGAGRRRSRGGMAKGVPGGTGEAGHGGGADGGARVPRLAPRCQAARVMRGILLRSEAGAPQGGGVYIDKAPSP